MTAESEEWTPPERGRPDPRAASGRVPTDSDRASSRAAAAARIQQQATWVDLQVRQAMERGAFDDLPGAGKPIDDLGSQHDPDWWVKQLVERERITGVLPPALQLRKDDAELDDRLDALASEAEVRRELDDFNGRVLAARRQLEGGPPVITQTRDVAETLSAWRERRTARRTAAASAAAADPPPRRRWWRRERRHTG